MNDLERIAKLRTENRELREENKRLITLVANQGKEISRLKGLSFVLEQSIQNIIKIADSTKFLTNKGSLEESKKGFESVFSGEE